MIFAHLTRAAIRAYRDQNFLDKRLCKVMVLSVAITLGTQAVLVVSLACGYPTHPWIRSSVGWLFPLALIVAQVFLWRTIKKLRAEGHVHCFSCGHALLDPQAQPRCPECGNAHRTIESSLHPWIRTPPRP